MDIRKKFYTMRIVSQNALLREVVMALSLIEFKHQDDAL